MNPLWGHLTGVITLILMLCFIGTWAWLWDRRHLPKFDALARLPLEDQPLENQAPAQQSAESRPRHCQEAP